MKTKMQSVMWSLALATGLMAALPVVRAADENGQPPKKEQRQGGPGMNLEMLREKLKLTDAQVEKLKPILAAEREEVMAKRKELGQDADREKMREAMKTIREKYKAQIEAVLTPEQKELFAKLRERRGPGGPGGPGGGKPKGDTPPPAGNES